MFRRLMLKADHHIPASRVSALRAAINRVHVSSLVFKQTVKAQRYLSTSAHESKPERLLSTPVKRIKIESSTDQKARSDKQAPKSDITFGSVLGKLTTALYFGSVGYGLHWMHERNIRERTIVRSSAKLEQGKATPILGVDQLVKIQPKLKGELSGVYVQNLVDKAIYLKKGAQTFDSLFNEFIISNFLALLSPGVQPECLISEEKTANQGISRFHTLSRIYPNSIDMEDFILNGGYQDKLKKKPIVGFEWALAADHLFAKQSDMKFANYILIEMKDCYIARSIDHERAETFPIGRTLLMEDIEDLSKFVWETRNDDNGKHLKLSRDRRTKEFIEIAKTFMKPENVKKFYESVAKADFSPLIKQIDQLEHVGFLSREESQKYKAYVMGKQDVVKEYLAPQKTASLALK